MRFSDEQWLPEDEASATIGVDFRVSGQAPILPFSVTLVAYHPSVSGAQDGCQGEESQAQHMGINS